MKHVQTVVNTGVVMVAASLVKMNLGLDYTHAHDATFQYARCAWTTVDRTFIIADIVDSLITWSN